MRHTATHTEVEAGGGQHDVIGSGRQRRNDDENDERDKEFGFDYGLRPICFLWLTTDADFRGQPTESAGVSKTFQG